MGARVLLLYEAVHWVAFSVESPGHSADQDFGVTSPSVLWQSVQQAQRTVIIHQDPGHGLTLAICDAVRWEVADEVFNVHVTLLVPSELPGLIHQVDVGKVKR